MDGWLTGGRTVGLFYGIIAGIGLSLISWSVGSLSSVVTVETLTVDWSAFWKRAIYNAATGVLFGLLFFGLFVGAVKHLECSLAECASCCCWVVFCIRGYGWFAVGIGSKVKAEKTSPNQGVEAFI